jgi:hypothetical protein
MSDTHTGDEPPIQEGGEGGGGADADESFTLGGPRGRDAERGEYYKPEEDGIDAGDDG